MARTLASILSKSTARCILVCGFMLLIVPTRGSSISIMGGKKFQTKYRTVADVYGEAFANKWHMQASVFTNERKEECFERGAQQAPFPLLHRTSTHSL
eukprot:SAG31_NODE_4398_length_3239_cov_6.414380_4_plen_98_part_00